MNDITYYTNGTWVHKKKATIPFNDAGFLYGDGLFETIRFENRVLFRPEDHLARLRSGLEILSLDLSMGNAKIIKLLEQCLQKNQIENGLVRLIITRGIIDQTVPWDHQGRPGIYIAIRHLSPVPEFPVKIIFLNESSYPIIRFKPAIKSVNYLGNMLAKKEAARQDAFEPVFVNREGYITECAIRNIFFIRGNKLLTPSRDLGVLPGIMRQSIIELSGKAGLSSLETQIHIDDIHKMDEAFISSTGIGILPCYWDAWQSNYEKTQKLRKLLFHRISQ